MRRREFITVLGSALAWPVPAHAQQAERLRRIGVLSSYAEGDPEAQTRVASLREGLRELGWTEGGNIAIDYRYAAGDPERARTYAAELVGLTPDLIFCHGGPVANALQQATRTIPIVFANVTDPVTAGLVGSLARPGGNITGFANYEYTMAGKWLQILNEVAPRLSQVLVVLNPENPISVGLLRDVESAASSIGVKLAAKASVRDPAQMERTIAATARIPNGGLLVLPDAGVAVHRRLIIELAGRHRTPAVYPFRFYAEDGGLISYGVQTLDLFRRATSYIDRILKGEKPADLPVQAPTKFELVINLKTAKALGLEVPASLLVRADEVIE